MMGDDRARAPDSSKNTGFFVAAAAPRECEDEMQVEGSKTPNAIHLEAIDTSDAPVHVTS